jgi:hypothetical protein
MLIAWRTVSLFDGEFANSSMTLQRRYLVLGVTLLIVQSEEALVLEKVRAHELLRESPRGQPGHLIRLLFESKV